MTDGPDQADGCVREKRIVCIGECMVELAHQGPSMLQMAFGGDTSNTAVYIARLTRDLPFAVDYVTALGEDAYSEAMLAFWEKESVGTGLVTRLPGRLPGLYTIRTDASGERSFTYWRGEAAARELLRDGRDAVLADGLRGVDLIYLSGITLSILDDPQREALLDLLANARKAGAKVAFDSNYRSAGWPGVGTAKAWFGRLLGQADLALPTLDDERALGGDIDAAAVADGLHDLGVGEVVVKQGGAGCFLSADGRTSIVDAVLVDEVVDSTAAGDSFNAGYLAARLAGCVPEDAARLAHGLAGEVVRHRGAIIPIDAMPDLALTG